MAPTVHSPEGTKSPGGHAGGAEIVPPVRPAVVESEVTTVDATAGAAIGGAAGAVVQGTSLAQGVAAPHPAPTITLNPQPSAPVPRQLGLASIIPIGYSRLNTQAPPRHHNMPENERPLFSEAASKMGAKTEQLQPQPGAQPHMSTILAPQADRKKAEVSEKALKEKFWKEWNGKAGVEWREMGAGAPPKAGGNKENDVPPKARAKASAEKQEDFAAYMERLRGREQESLSVVAEAPTKPVDLFAGCNESAKQEKSEQKQKKKGRILQTEQDKSEEEKAEKSSTDAEEDFAEWMKRMKQKQQEPGKTQKLTSLPMGLEYAPSMLQEKGLGIQPDRNKESKAATEEDFWKAFRNTVAEELEKQNNALKKKGEKARLNKRKIAKDKHESKEKVSEKEGAKKEVGDANKQVDGENK